MFTFRETADAVDPVTDAIRRLKDQHGDLKGAVRGAEGEVNILKNTISGYRDELNRLSSIPILGSKGFSDAAFAIDQQIAAIQKQLNEKKLAMPALEAPGRGADKGARDAYEA